MATLTLPPELLQRHVEAFFAAESELRAGRSLVGAQLNGIAARVAARLGWLDVAEETVDDMHPGAVLRIASEINRAIAAAYELPGE
jgi:hypothetical protein